MKYTYSLAITAFLLGFALLSIIGTIANAARGCHARDALTGRYVPASYARANPSTTVFECGKQRIPAAQYFQMQQQQRR